MAFVFKVKNASPAKKSKIVAKTAKKMYLKYLSSSKKTLPVYY